MKNYYQLIMENFIDIYEKRKGFKRAQSDLNAIQIEPGKIFKEYLDRYNHQAYRDINAAIQKLILDQVADAFCDEAGKFLKVRLKIENVDSIYQKLNRTPIPVLCDEMRIVLTPYLNSADGLLNKFCLDICELLNQYKKLPYDIIYDRKKLNSILIAIHAILSLKQETYVRNFSAAIFKDSKEFIRLRSVIQSILYDYTDIVVEKERILEIYNLFDNPTYIMVKGQAIIHYEKSVIYLHEMDGGIAIPNLAIEKITGIKVLAERVITVENLTTYHDTSEAEAVVIYLGGFHNSSKQKFLKFLYAQNDSQQYYHKGDLDVYGFLILENLKEKTSIPFKPLEMDLDTLKRYYERGIYKNLSQTDKKAMKAEKLKEYQEIFDFMLNHDCKIEQESIKAAGIFAQ
ncbi:MAG: DUF2220 domain-containing protein [Lachnospiraceae bacterium]|nr:DUF2220 domain-containing protein [Lachnospiraceae bacterium]